MKDNILQRSLLCFLLIGFASFQAHAQLQKGQDIDGAAAGDLCGRSVSMAGPNTLAAGSHANSSGHARVFDWSGSAWVQRGGAMSGSLAGDFAGYSVSMANTNTIAVGVPRFDANFTNTGAVNVYDWSGSAWTMRGLAIYISLPNDEFGSSVSMGDANTVAIGAPFNDNPATNAGEVRVYEWNGTAWAQKGGDINGEASNDQFGTTVVMPDANTFAVGVPNNDGAGTDAGHVRVYAWSGTAWVQKGADIDGLAGDFAGAGVDMPDANTVAIGAPSNDGNGSGSGQVRVFTWNGTAWVQKGADIYGTATNMFFGNVCTMGDANSLVASGPINGGYVRAYSWDGNAWVQNGSEIAAESIGGGDSWGASLSMGDANTFCGGAPNNSGAGFGAGHARVFNFCSTSTSTLNPVTCDTYTSPSGLYTWTVAGTYLDTIPNAGGCDSVITVNLSIHTVDTSVSFSTGTYTATSSGTYQWVSCPGFTPISGATSQSFSPTANGSYAVIINDGTCSDTSSCHNEQIVGIEDPYQGRLVRVFPNPSSGAFTLALDGGQQIESVQVVDAAGKRVAVKDALGESAVALSLPQATGIYFLHVKLVNGETRFAKVVVE